MQLAQTRDAKIWRTEVVAPLRDAVCLVDHYQADVELTHLAHEALRLQTLGRNIEESAAAARYALPGHGALMVGHSCMKEDGADVAATEVVDLVLHQRHQRSDDDAETPEGECRNLEAYRLAATGRHEGERVMPGHGAEHDVKLQLPEVVIPPVLLQYRAQPRRFGFRIFVHGSCQKVAVAGGGVFPGAPAV